jgi:hypothetical protein
VACHRCVSAVTLTKDQARTAIHSVTLVRRRACVRLHTCSRSLQLAASAGHLRGIMSKLDTFITDIIDRIAVTFDPFT